MRKLLKIDQLDWGTNFMTATGRLWIEVLTKQNNTQLLGTGFTKQKTYNALTRIELQLIL